MFRLLTFAAFLAGLSAAHAAAPFPVGVQPEGKTPPSGTDRRKLIGDIQADYDRVLDNLNRADAGAETRAGQRRILQALDKLLEEPDSPDGNANSSPPPKQAEPAPPKPLFAPKPTPAPLSKQAAPAPPKPSPAQLPTASKPAPKQGLAAKPPPAVTLDALRERNEFPAGWAPDMPPRHRQALDAFARDRISPAYEELLRAYYRALAESGRE